MKIFLIIVSFVGVLSAQNLNDLNISNTELNVTNTIVDTNQTNNIITIAKNNESNITLNIVENNESNISDTISTILDTNETNTSLNSKTLLDTNKTIISLDDNNTISMLEETNTTTKVKVINEDTTKILDKFEKIFINHIAYIAYNKAIDKMYKGLYKEAYQDAMQAKSIYPQPKDSLLIPLPYMPSYLRESSYAPKKIYYKNIVYKSYEIERLITKIKLLSPPIPSVIIKRTSTYIDIIIRNYGDLPLDKFTLLIDGQSVIMYPKILPKEEKKFRLDKAPQIHELSFKETYGFAPDAIIVNEGY